MGFKEFMFFFIKIIIGIKKGVYFLKKKDGLFLNFKFVYLVFFR